MVRAQLALLLSLTILPACFVAGEPESDLGELSADVGRHGPSRVCTPGETWVCYTGPSASDSVGVCDRGIKTCNATGTAWGACVGEIVPSAETCNGRDDDCDGAVDDACTCTAGETVGCYDGPDGTADVGTCHSGTHVCNSDGVGYGACVGQITPVKEVCGDGLDNNCNGDLDEGCVCPPGETWVCYSGPWETDGVGACERGIKTCDADGMGYGACAGETVPTTEVCGNGIDDDCDGQTDEDCTACVPGSTLACYGGPAGTEGVGICHGGTRTCDGDGYGECNGQVRPGTEVCGNGLDDDCDGQVDDGCVCAPGSTVACYDGPAGTAGVGTCHGGVQTCDASGGGFGACTGSVGPIAEVCDDELDNDCDGQVDEGCVCAPASTVVCYSGPEETNGVGVCHAGVTTCNPDGGGFGECAGEVLPGAETCGNGLDDDCDGVADDLCVCLPGTMSACYTGPVGTAGVGVCSTGSQSCNGTGTGFEVCVGSVLPSTEVCGDGLDNDCDGQVDEGCIGDRAWNDRNRNGIQDAGEAGLAGVTFILRTGSGAVVAVATTNASGAYSFANIPFGTYYIEVVGPIGFSVVVPNRGSDDNLDSDFDDETLRTPNFPFTGTSRNISIDCGFVPNIST